MLNILTKVFGSKHERDIKTVIPLVEEINTYNEKFHSLTNEELRAKTESFKAKIHGHLQPIDEEISNLKKKLEEENEESSQNKELLFEELDKLEKERDEKIEEVLNELLPEAFAVVKETCRRFKENEKLYVQATEFDKQLAAKKSYVEISGDTAVWKNQWTAAGGAIKWDMVHYDVQLMGGIVLHQGTIAEMATGEGKTLVSTLPVYLNALAGNGVHLVTVNDYLARRDSEWNGPIFEFHGLSVDCIDKYEPNSDERRNAYRSDITYGTNNEFGFDYLRDNMAAFAEHLVQRKLHYAIVDEVDSVLVDEARTPLIISGQVPHGEKHEFQDLKPRIEKLVNAQKKLVNDLINEAKKYLEKNDTEKGGLAIFRGFRGLPKNKALIKLLGEPGMKAVMQKTEYFYLQDNAKKMPEVDEELYFVIDEKHNQIELTEKGREIITGAGEDKDFFVLPDLGAQIAETEQNGISSPEEKLRIKDELSRKYAEKSDRLHSVNQLLKAYTLFEKDIEYIIQDDKVMIVDEHTGRVLPGRRYSDGLHQAIEAKENVKIENASQTLATISLQNYFRMYHKLAGMTGTAETEAGEFFEIYKLDVVVIPTNKPMVRKDDEDLVYKTRREKYNAVIEEIINLTKAGRPVLVGTTSVEVSELLSRMLKLRNIKHNVLNAKQHQREAQIVAEAGIAGTVTIATNMAGRGTDIKLGTGVKDAGGLAIVGTERHEARRIDRQLRGRAGRQGDPGTSQFYVSLEDDLMRLFGSERIAKLMDTMGIKEGEVIQHSMVTGSIARAQKKVEQNNFAIRKRLIEYDNVMNLQRNVIYTKRKHALFGDRIRLDSENMIHDLCEEVVTKYHTASDYENFKLDCIRYFAIDAGIPQEEFLKENEKALTEKLFQNAMGVFLRKEKMLAERVSPFIKDLYETKGGQVREFVIPFSDGVRIINIFVNLERAYQNKGREVFVSLERGVSLGVIDDKWKDQLREMDDLRTSVQNAVYEQKDPLLIYKFEAFNMFQQMLKEINLLVISLLFKAEIPVPQEARQQEKRKMDMSRMRARHDEAAVDGASRPPMPNAANTKESSRPEPVRVEKQTGRNDPCPCGSGKKYKHCHGK